MPMIVSWPGVTSPASVCQQNVIIEDFFPTILQLAGVQDSQQVGGVIDGKTFVPLLRGEAQNDESSRPLVWHFPNNWGPRGPGIGPSSSILCDGWKLIFYYGSHEFELFNVAKDIGEERNLAHEYPAKRNELAAELDTYLKHVNAQYPIDKKTGKPITIPVADSR